MASHDVFKALSDPTRRQILRLLRDGSLTAGQLADSFDVSKASMSHHFSVLKSADLIRSERNGQQIVYSLNTTVLQDVTSLLLELLSAKPQRKGAKT
jgi:ArsR family transcriptional regulator